MQQGTSKGILEAVSVNKTKVHVKWVLQKLLDKNSMMTIGQASDKIMTLFETEYKPTAMEQAPTIREQESRHKFIVKVALAMGIFGGMVIGVFVMIAFSFLLR
jgi:carbohydrate-binding DOMON domain-containing protein